MTAVHWIIGTAGHIDHGKTSLVKALTGTDTDRLKEEKERGISIDLGFASLALPDGTQAGVVDVPGHERFIKNMLAGAHGIDLVLFTIAADDGVMPQTEEHLDIVHLLGIRRAVFVVTKADLVRDDRITEVAEEIRLLAAGTALEGSPIVPFALPRLEGLDQVRAAIVDALRDAGKTPPSGRFRLPVDRAFVSAGHGLIVTGTAISGEVRIGDRVRCLPSGELLRVRGVQVHGAPVDSGSWGQRVALNLSGSVHVPVARGHVIGDEAITLTCDRFDAAIEVRSTVGRALKDHQRVRVHIGTAELMGKVILFASRQEPGARTVVPGGRAFCQVVLSRPAAAMRGDRFVLRDETAQRTIGGGTVLRPAAPRRSRTDPRLLDRLETLAHGEAGPLIATLIEDSGEFALPLPALAELLNEADERIRSRADAAAELHRFVLDGDVYYSTAKACAVAGADVVGAIRAWHAARPLSPGLDIEEARSALEPKPSARILRQLIDELERQGAIAREGSVLRLPSHRVQVTGEDRAIVDRISSALLGSPLAPPDVQQLSEALGVDRAKLLLLLKTMEQQQQVVAIAPDLYLDAGAVRRLRDELARDPGAALTPAAFRDRYKTSRKYSIPLLEYFDRTGLTVRIGDVRRLRQPPSRT